MPKKNWTTLFILGATVILAVIAVITALRLYQTRQEPIAPTAPQPAPALEPTATPIETDPVAACSLSFNVGGVTITPSPTPTVSPKCWTTCTSKDDCPSSLECQTVDGAKHCVNPDCPEEEDCDCPEGPTSTPTPGPSSTPTPGPTSTPTPKAGVQPTATPIPLPEAGVTLPTWLTAIGAGALVILGLIFAL